VKLGSVKLVPPNTDDIPFREYATGAWTANEFAMEYGLSVHGDLPDPVEEPFRGLGELMNRDAVVSHTWTVRTDSGVVRTTDEKAIPKEIYERAVSHADDFLPSVGLGIEIGSEPVGFT